YADAKVSDTAYGAGWDGDTTNAPSKNAVYDKIETMTPSGVIMAYGGSSAPTGWLLCDGNAVSRTTYASLFAVVGETYGVGDGSTTFNVPDLTGKVPVGYSGVAPFNALANTGGQKDAYLKNHIHTFPVAASGGSETAESGTSPWGSGNTSSAGDGDGTNGNLPPYLVINYIIKT
ncbi:MAG: tail fiber protein, partial [Pseudomonadota bacterium]